MLRNLFYNQEDLLANDAHHSVDGIGAQRRTIRPSDELHRILCLVSENGKKPFQDRRLLSRTLLRYGYWDVCREDHKP